MQEGSGVPNLQTELNYLDSFKTYCNFSYLGFLSSAGGVYLGWPAIVYMSSGVFTGKESSNNRVILISSRHWILVIWAPCGSWGWRVGGCWVGGCWVGGWGCGVVGVPHTHVHMHVHAHICTHSCMHVKHDNFMQMAAPIGQIPGNSLWCHMHACVHAHTCAHVCGAPHLPPLISTHLPTPRGDPGISKNSIRLELIKIFQFCLKIWNLWRLCHLWVGVWVDGWVRSNH